MLGWYKLDDKDFYKSLILENNGRQINLCQDKCDSSLPYFKEGVHFNAD